MSRKYPPPLDRLRAGTDTNGPVIKPALGACHVWTGFIDGEGYGRIRVDGINRGTHVAAWLLQVGPVPEGMAVLHKCDNPPCVRLDHLFVGTPGDNVADMVAKGRQNAGERNGNARFTDVQVAQMRAARAAGETCKVIAVRYDTTPGYVSQLTQPSRPRR